MVYNIYKLSWDDFKLHNINDTVISSSISKILNLVEDEIANLYKLNQTNRIGISSLGNHIRRSKLINEYLNSDDNIDLVKMTENSRSFLYSFLNGLENNDKKHLCFFSYSKSFNRISRLVDNSHITIDSISDQLQLLGVHFDSRVKREVFFIEITSFERYFFENLGDYSRIHNYGY